MSSSQDNAVAGPSRVTPPSVLRLPRPGVPATVTSGAHITDPAHQTYIRGGVVIATAPEEDPLDITSGWGGDVECEVVIDNNSDNDNDSLPSPGASVLVTAAPSATTTSSGANNTIGSRAAESLTQQRQTIASASTLSSAAESDHPRQRKGKKAAAARPTPSPDPTNKMAVAAYVDMVRDKKRVQRLKELRLILCYSCLYGISYYSTGTV
jgi:hypothetical protein